MVSFNNIHEDQILIVYFIARYNIHLNIYLTININFHNKILNTDYFKLNLHYFINN